MIWKSVSPSILSLSNNIHRGGQSSARFKCWWGPHSQGVVSNSWGKGDSWGRLWSFVGSGSTWPSPQLTFLYLLVTVGMSIPGGSEDSRFAGTYMQAMMYIGFPYYDILYANHMQAVQAVLTGVLVLGRWLWIYKVLYLHDNLSPSTLPLFGLSLPWWLGVEGLYKSTGSNSYLILPCIGSVVHIPLLVYLLSTKLI